MLEALFPEDVLTVVANEDAWQGRLLPEEERDLGSVGEARRRDFRAGRTCARRALARLGLPPAPLLRRPDRSPAWPAGAVGSISHCPGFCAAAVASAARYGALGLDVEVAGRARPTIVRRVCTDAERERLAELGPHGLGILFSAKEAFYKAWHPLTGAVLGFRDATVDVDLEAGRLVVRLVREDAPAVLGRREAEGRFILLEGYIAAGVTLPRS